MNTSYETDRLTLRILTRREAPMVLDFYKCNLEDFSKFEPMPYPAVTTLKFHQEMLDYEYQAYLETSSIRYHIFEKNNPFRIIGTISLRNINTTHYSSCVIGYKMDSMYRNRGYCTEALAVLLTNAERDIPIHRTEALVMPNNPASWHMLEKLGFEREGLLRDKIRLNGKWEDHYLYARIAG